MPHKNLLSQLRNHTYIHLKASKIHGIGVFALQTIPKGSRNIFSKGIGEWIKVPIKEVDQLPEHSKLLIETYCLFDKEHYFVPEYGFNMVDPVIYLNHSSKPNIISINDGEEFEAIDEIVQGEELLINYEEIADGLKGYN